MPTATLVLLAALLLVRAGLAQSSWRGSVSGGLACLFTPFNPDDNDQCSYSVTVTGRRDVTGVLSLGLQAGHHVYVADIRTEAATRFGPLVRAQSAGSTLRLYGEVGAAVYAYRLRYAGTDSRTYMGVHLGAGVEIFPKRSRVGIVGAFQVHPVLDFVTLEVGASLR